MFNKLLVFILLICAQTAYGQSTIVFMHLKNNHEHKLKLVQEPGFSPKIFAYLPDEKRWQRLEIIKHDSEDHYIKFKHTNNIIYHGYVFEERLLMLLDVQGSVWRYVRVNNFIDPKNHGNKDCIASLLQKDFEQLQSDIKSLAYDKTKFSTAKSFLRGHCITVAQLNALLLNFESDQFKCEFAQYMYPFTSDKHNFKQVLKGIKSTEHAAKLLQALGI
jgi:hypothetical protein